MPDADREYIGGWLVVEHHDFRWDQGVSDPDVKIVVCGEIGHARWNLFQLAWREACWRDLELALQAFADRVGVKYSPTPRRRLAAPHKEHNAITTEATS